MEKFTSKVLMFGEYSLLYNSMALTMPFEKFSGQFSYADPKNEDHLAILSNQGLRKFCQHMLENHTDEAFKLNVEKFKAELDKGLFFESNIPQGFGLGSSGALVAAIFLRYLDKAGDFKDEIKYLTKEKVHQLKKCLGGLEGYFHGTSSGIDPLSILINAPLLLKSESEIIPVEVPAYNRNGQNVIFLLNTGLARNTGKLVGQFKSACESNAFKDKLENELIQYTNQGIESFLKADSGRLYKNLDHLVKFQLNEMDYLIPDAFQSTVKNGLDNGTYFLKICGSGGGGYMLGFTENWEEAQKQLQGKDLEILYRF